MTDAQTIRRLLMAALPHFDHQAMGHDWTECWVCCDGVTENIETDDV